MNREMPPATSGVIFTGDRLIAGVTRLVVAFSLIEANGETLLSWIADHTILSAFVVNRINAFNPSKSQMQRSFFLFLRRPNVRSRTIATFAVFRGRAPTVCHRDAYPLPQRHRNTEFFVGTAPAAEASGAVQKKTTLCFCVSVAKSRSFATRVQARRESNPQPPVLETGALPIELRTSAPLPGWLTGLEPATSGATVRRSNRLSYNHHAVVRPRRPARGV